MPKHYLVLLIFLCLVLTTSCRQVTSPGTVTVAANSIATDPATVNSDSADIIQMLKEGVGILKKQDSSPDSKDYGEALVLTALERFADRHPGIATEVMAVYASYVDQESNAPRRYMLYVTLQNYLEQSLSLCGNTTSFQDAWKVRQEIVGKQQKAVIESVSKLLKDDDLNPFFDDIKDNIESILNKIDVEFPGKSAAAKEIEKLRDSVTEITGLLHKKLSKDIEQFKEQIAEEKAKDADSNNPIPLPQNKATSSDEWELGAYQRIIEKVKQFLIISEDTSIAYWTDFPLPDAIADANIKNQLIEVHNEAKRLQHIRYNLYVLQHLENSPARANNNPPYVPEFARIDRNVLLPPVEVLYSIRLSEYLTVDGIRTGMFGRISREIIGTPKIGLEAF